MCRDQQTGLTERPGETWNGSLFRVNMQYLTRKGRMAVA